MRDFMLCLAIQNMRNSFLLLELLPNFQLDYRLKSYVKFNVKTCKANSWSHDVFHLLNFPSYLPNSSYLGKHI